MSWIFALLRKGSRRIVQSVRQKVLLKEPATAATTDSVFMNRNKRYAGHQIGDWTYGAPEVRSPDKDSSLRIGRFCSIAGDVNILLGGEHRTDWVTTYPFNFLFSEAREFTGHPRTKGNVVIGNDVWIGYGALILSGVTIGNGAVVAARSVVTRDVEPYSIVAGNPARHVRYRFPDATRKALESIAWWDWPLPKIMDALPLLLSTEIDAFVGKYGKD